MALKRYETEMALRESEERYRSLVEASPDAITLTDLDTKVLMCDRQAAVLHGFEKVEQIIGKRALEFFVSEDHQRAERNSWKTLKKGCVRNVEYTLIKKDGTCFPAELTASVIRDAEGNPRAFMALTRDISERKRSQEELIRQKTLLDELFNGVQEGIGIVDEDETIIFCNPAFAKTFDGDSDHLVGKNLLELFNSKGRSLILQQTKERRAGKISTYEIELTTAKGSQKHIRVTVSPRFGVDGSYIGAFGTFFDITSRKQAEQELKRSYEKLQKLFEETIHVLASAMEARDPYTAGHQRRVTSLAYAIAVEMGLPEEQITGLRMAALIHDIGKIFVPAEILSKPGQLMETEFNLIKLHSQAGHDILNGIEFPWPIARIVLQHHERMDGSGFPQGLLGKDILLEARILAVSDVVEAMVSHRPYRPAHKIEEVLEEISKNKRKLYDPQVVDVCLRVFSEKGFKF